MYLKLLLKKEQKYTFDSFFYKKGIFIKLNSLMTHIIIDILLGIAFLLLLYYINLDVILTKMHIYLRFMHVDYLKDMVNVFVQDSYDDK